MGGRLRLGRRVRCRLRLRGEVVAGFGVWEGLGEGTPGQMCAVEDGAIAFKAK